MTGSSKNPDPVFESLVKTYVKRELRRIPDVEVVPLEAKSYDYHVHLLGREIYFKDGRPSGNYALSTALVWGSFLEIYEAMWLYTGPRTNLEEGCVSLVGGIDDHLDAERIRRQN